MVRLTSNGSLDEVVTPVIPLAERVALDALPDFAPAGAVVVPPAPSIVALTSESNAIALSLNALQYTNSSQLKITTLGVSIDRAVIVKWAIPEKISKSKVKYTATASPAGRTWVKYTFTVKAVSASALGVTESGKSAAIKPSRVLERGKSIAGTQLVTAPSAGKKTWKVTGGYKLSTDQKTFTTSAGAELCSLRQLPNE